MQKPRGNPDESAYGTSGALDRKLLAYALAGGAALVAPAQADIISYSGPTLSTLGGAINLDLNGDTTVDFIFSSLSGGASVSNSVDPNGLTNGVTPTPLAADASVASASMTLDSITVLNAASSTKKTPFTPTNLSFPNGVDSYMGLTFIVSGQQHYGWALVNASLSGSYPALQAQTEIKAFAYQNTPGADILAGQTVDDPAPIPEPSTLALLALGSAGLALARRRRAARA